MPGPLVFRFPFVSPPHLDSEASSGNNEDMEKATSNTRSSYPLSTKKPLKKTIARVPRLLVFILCSIAILLSIVLEAELFEIKSSHLFLIVSSLLGFFALFTIFRYIYEYLYYLKYYYELTENFVVIRKGVFSESEVTIQYGRIQDVYVDQDVLDRIFGLYDVHISSATLASGYLAHIDGVEKESAEALKQIFLSSIQEHQSQHLSKQPQNSVVPVAPTADTNQQSDSTALPKGTRPIQALPSKQEPSTQQTQDTQNTNDSTTHTS